MPPNPKPRTPAYLLVGNYGVGNAGDEILREYFLEHFPKVEWQVLSAHPSSGELPRFPGGVRSLFSLRWFRTLRALRKADGIVFGGGSLWTDLESVRACFLWSVHAWFARLCGKPYFLAFQGIGPFRTRVGEWLTRWVIAHASFISVRDSFSFERLSGLSSTEPRACRGTSGEASRRSAARFARGEYCRVEGACPEPVEGWKKSTRVIQSFDPSFSLLKATKENLRTKNLFIFIPRFSTGWDGQTQRKFLSFFEEIRAKGGEVRILSLHPTHAAEEMLCRVFADALQLPIETVSSLRGVASFIVQASCVLTERYHGALAALASGVPFFVLRREEGDKLDALAEECNCPSETLASFSQQTFLEVNWEERTRDLFAVWNKCEELVRVGEEELRKALG